MEVDLSGYGFDDRSDDPLATGQEFQQCIHL
jgi:hypothetical protein